MHVLVVSLLLLAPAPKAAPRAATPASAAPAPAPVEKVDDTLRRAVNEYAYGNYTATIEQMRGLLYPMRLNSDAQVIEARKFLGLSYYLTNSQEAMKEEFAKLLYLEPDYQLDPFSVPPPIIEAFEEVRTSMQTQLDVIRLRRKEITNPEPVIRRLNPPQQTSAKSDLVSVLPFGAGQFQNGDDSLGTFFAVSEAVLLAVNIGAFIGATYGVGDNYSSDRSGLVTALTVTQYSALSLFAITWGVGAYQARMHMSPRMNTDVTQPGGTAFLRDPGMRLPAATGVGFSLAF